MRRTIHPSKFVGPKLPIPDSMSTDWWGRNSLPRNLVESKPRVDTEAKSAFELLLKQQPVGATYDDIKQVAIKLYDTVNSPLSMGLKAALLSGDVDHIANCKVEPSAYQLPSGYFLDACAAAFLRKFEALGELCGLTDSELERRTIDEFFRAERQCLETNQRISTFAEGISSPISEHIVGILDDAKDIIKQLLGKAPKVEDLVPKFGPGATSACKGESVTIADKLIALPELTWDSRHFISVVQNSPVWLSLIERVHPSVIYDRRFVTDDYGNQLRMAKIAPRLVRGNRFTTVPKDAKIKRGICIEPHTLSCLQLACGTLLSELLTGAGICKELQQEVNRGFAMIGSMFDLFATVDLKAASDTLAYELVKLLLPWDWFVLLASLRSGETWVDGQWVELEKFSSMGNGFTFELETLIFYALARSVSNHVQGAYVTPVCAYGDDLIIASECYSTLQMVLDFCGFTVNDSKSFFEGSFRESCGGDYFAGYDVRPYFLKETPYDSTDWYGIANGVAKLNERCSALGLGPTHFGSTWHRCVNHIPKALRLYGPKGQGDDWIHSESEGRWRRTTRHGINYVLGRRRVPRYRQLNRYCNDTQYAVLLYGGYAEKLPLRGDPHCVIAEWYVV